MGHSDINSRSYTMFSSQSLTLFLFFAILALKTDSGSGNRGHDGNLFDDAASVLDNFFG